MMRQHSRGASIPLKSEVITGADHTSGGPSFAWPTLYPRGQALQRSQRLNHQENCSLDGSTSWRRLLSTVVLQLKKPPGAQCFIGVADTRCHRASAVLIAISMSLYDNTKLPATCIGIQTGTHSNTASCHNVRPQATDMLGDILLSHRFYTVGSCLHLNFGSLATNGPPAPIDSRKLRQIIWENPNRPHAPHSTQNATKIFFKSSKSTQNPSKLSQTPHSTQNATKIFFKSSKSTQNPSKLSQIPQNTTKTSQLLLNQLHLLEFWYLGAQWWGIPPEFPEASCQLRATSCGGLFCIESHVKIADLGLQTSCKPSCNFVQAGLGPCF